ncbi:MAG TPA: hypothetical protein VHW46_09825 [Terracidiphilus sp.]|jgi:hypothetical protein|nr:hypothetical protein [Terracidiphilus sp.]
MKTLRLWLGTWLLRHALDVLPVDSDEAMGIARGLTEQRLYSRYEGWCQIAGTAPRAFFSWRQIRETIYTKFASTNRVIPLRSEKRRRLA